MKKPRGSHAALLGLIDLQELPQGASDRQLVAHREAAAVHDLEDALSA